MLFFRDFAHLAESTIALMVPQIIITYLLLDVFVPKMLDKKKFGLFVAVTIVTMVVLLAGYIALRKYYFDVVYFDTYNDVAKAYAQLSVMERLTDPGFFVSKLDKLLTPAALLFTNRLF